MPLDADTDYPATFTEVDVKTLIGALDPDTKEDREPVVYVFSNGKKFVERED